ncbi:alcohol dehydrogenase AdhP [Rhizobium rhizogenes]|jgi:propanol-preferring alcohol dehydrogenase|uniref:alcohol dehydrogenase n=2 Tax=Rhizobium rhizogenes TaxID=359 RepID=B9JNA5_RHIR8|nr:alcohol dehydrogenase AdhP [Rhizobium rhizogenes]ACM29036.1 alcohol dehydrogenase protein [Rhizobium rhizogenes K84]OCI93578.1 zinc-dependent alcohol dehydrogenase [Agrobacterium sp. 13-626]OCJ18723.1 zinc-dependent alcohol dehydrogenase [Agrobacterium sp. B131/95]OCJ20767.1 zinc-dependent alcohol dehydrogenase [Agrobacterium sp. B133/95]MDJ1634259.1 alcohol dehydrogenase AdhP [Rhizobium rhizogenes]
MITKTMMAAVVHRFGEPLVIESVPVPVPGPGELLVKVIACGVCHTDLHAADGDWPVKPSPPFIPGHEVAGIVAALGQGVTDFKLGDPVGVAWLHDACMRCEYCETGWETLCEHQHDTGYSCDGGFAEYVIASAAFTARLPANVDFAQIAPILCAGVTTYKGLKETEARPGEWVAISGIGGLGHVAIQYAKAMGLKIVALDVTPEKLTLARATGADVVIDARSPDAIADVLKATGGGAHGILVTAVSPPAFSQALQMVRRKGTIALVGLPPGEFPTPIFDVVLKRITLRGSIVGTRRDLDEAIAFAVEGKVKADITKVPLNDINAIFAKLKAGKVEGRMVLDFTIPITTSKQKEERAPVEV